MIDGLKTTAKRLAGQKPEHYTVAEADQLVADWDFRRSRADYISVFRRWRLLKSARPFPEAAMLKPPRANPRWTVYFIFSPNGRLSPAHLYTLRQLRTDTAKLLVVFASADRDAIPADLTDRCDALYWKSLPGFDFSGYALGLAALARHSAGADVLVMNDSVFGPFGDLNDIWDRALWDLTGFTASANIENHLQSYAFALRRWNPMKLAALSRIFRTETCFDSYEAVVLCQETLLARVARRQMTVGALWYADFETCIDPSVFASLSLFDAGFPFLKKSLLTKHAGRNDVELVRQALMRNGHPVD